MRGFCCSLLGATAFSPSYEPGERFGLAARESSPHVRPFCYVSFLVARRTLKFISLPLTSLLQIAWRRERLAFRFCPLAETLRGTLITIVLPLVCP
jgi:hypothetical protein